MGRAMTLQDNAPTGDAGRRPRLAKRLRRRYLDVLASIYIYNEHRGYRSLDRVLEAVRARCPDDAVFIAQVEKHRADEARHYAMFRRYFELRGAMPFAVDRTCGHIDRLIKLSFGCHIDDLDTAEVVADEAMFARLCRVIMLTEMRGMHMVDDLLQSAAIRADRPLYAIFKAVERDEPSHWMPYDAWLKEHGGSAPSLAERIADSWVHLSLMLVKLPLLYCNPWLRRRVGWQHEDDDAIDAVRVQPV
jgi:hypothetical protein